MGIVVASEVPVELVILFFAAGTFAFVVHALREIVDVMRDR